VSAAILKAAIERAVAEGKIGLPSIVEWGARQDGEVVTLQADNGPASFWISRPHFVDGKVTLFATLGNSLFVIGNFAVVGGDEAGKFGAAT
jgi:hypothetical protein